MWGPVPERSALAWTGDTRPLSMIHSISLKSRCQPAPDAPVSANPSRSPRGRAVPPASEVPAGRDVRFWGLPGCDRVHPWAGIVAGRGSLHTLTIAGPRPPAAPVVRVGMAGQVGSLQTPRTRPLAPPTTGSIR
ncbi:hypothetical protein MILUP08_43169 [Micromonospora lupini str. Lupac 08]|uniref:Uncharacterized protein n=1 Tax=Micromonospora lupini str. Lupac 08 TaxID=1150864 RepID=I0L367_9ACTN|nr:hypothetical protein MILUP08_43169 [Micromonospora lupini str. Lupac 08]